MFGKKVKLCDELSRNELLILAAILAVVTKAREDDSVTRRTVTVLEKIKNDKKVTKDEMVLIIESLTAFAAVAKDQNSENAETATELLGKVLRIYSKTFG